MNVKSYLLIGFLLVSILATGQHHSLMHSDIAIDTSYTFHSALLKHRKHYPDITLAKPVPEHAITEHRNLVYQTYGNRDMHLDVFEPATVEKGKRPCVLFVHGGGWASGDKVLLEPFAVAMAGKGMVTVTIEYRLSQEAQYPAAVIDINSAMRWINQNAKKYHIDRNQISIMGSSAGGQLATLIGVTADQDLFVDPNFLPKVKTKIHSIIDLDGVIAFIHPLSKEGGKPGKPGASTKWFGVHFSQDSTKWIEASPITYVGKHTPPTLFVASKYPRFNAGREDMIQIMNKYHIYNETHVFEDAPHSYWLFNPWFEPTLNYTLEFLKKLD